MRAFFSSSMKGINAAIKARRAVLLLLLMLFALWLKLPSLDYLPMLSVGDNGRDLYAFQKTAKGALPYRDYQWEYGPLMPYYYAFFLKLFGPGLQSVLLGQNILFILSGAAVFLITGLFAAPLMSFAAALWFLAFQGDFFYTFNHTGGVLAILSTLFFLLRYLKDSNNKNAALGALGLGLLALIRPNMAVALSLAFFPFLWLSDKINGDRPKTRFYLELILIPGLLLLAIYGILLGGLPQEYIGQCFHYGSSFSAHGGLAPQLLSSLKFLGRVIARNLSATLIRRLITALFILYLARLGFLFYRERRSREKVFLLALPLLVLFAWLIVSAHEFIFDQAIFRLNWLIPIFIVLLFYVFEKAAVDLKPPLFKNLLLTALLLIALTQLFSDRREVLLNKTAPDLLKVKTTAVYIPGQKEWIKTVTAASDFIIAKTRFDEKIFAVPYEPLYYFLTGREAAVRELFFFERFALSSRQQEAIIESLEKKRVRFVIVSNRAAVFEPLIGHFGFTHSRLLARYIFSHYIEAAAFGDWKAAPGWNENHAVKILKRIEP